MARPMPDAAPGDHGDPAHRRLPPRTCACAASMAHAPNRAQGRLSKNENGIATPCRRSLGSPRRRSWKGDPVRIGLMIGPEKGRYRDKVARLVADAEAAEQAGFTSIWVPQVPNDFDALTAIALMGRATVAHRARDRGDADPDPPPHRDGAAGAREPGGVRGPVHARPRTVAPLDRHGHARPPVRAAGPPRAQLPRGPERRVRRSRARSTSRTTTSACTTRSTSPTSCPTPDPRSPRSRR